MISTDLSSLSSVLQTNGTSAASSFNLNCYTCPMLAYGLIYVVIPDLLVFLITKACSMAGYHENVCNGIVKSELEVLFNGRTEYGWLNWFHTVTPQRLCGTLLENANCRFFPQGPQVDWSVNSSSWGEKPISKSLTENPKPESLSIIQITDIHFDPKYKVGKTSNCREPLCCRSGQANAVCLDDSATKYGHYNYCDVSLDVITSVLEDTVKRHKNISMVYMTGDLVSHAIWETSKNQTINIMKRVGALFRKYLGDIPVIPALGNHDTHPVNIFAPHFVRDEFSTKWAYKGFIDNWGWSLPESARDTFLKGGYYSFHKDKNFRVVVLNSNVYQKTNWWNILYPEDPNDQLAWLATTLLEAEKNKEKVHILSHIPPGSEDTMQVYQREYRKIIDRFEHTVTAEFNGHTHFEDLTLMYDKKNTSRPIKVAFNGGSVTSYNNVNPNYRRYKVDPQTLDVTDYDSYVYNISTVKNDAPARWHKLYSFNQEYGLKALTPEDVNDMVIRMMDDEVLFHKYFYNRYKGSNQETYDLDHKVQILCDMLTAEMEDSRQCNLLHDVINSHPKGKIGDEYRKRLNQLKFSGRQLQTKTARVRNSKTRQVLFFGLRRG